MKIIDNAKMASVVWNDLNIEQQKAIKKSFHLRPTKIILTRITCGIAVSSP